MFNSMFSCILQLNEMSRHEWEWEGMGMGGNGNELSGAIRECDRFFKCVNFGNGKELAGMGGIGNTENHSRTSLIAYVRTV